MTTVRKQRPKIVEKSLPILKWLLISFSSFVFIFCIYALYLSNEIPSLKDLENSDSSLRTEIFSQNNHLIGTIFKEDRKNVNYDQFPKHLIDALIMTEDSRFYDHSGIDLMGWIRAISSTGRWALGNLIGAKWGKKSGASTLSMQLAGNLWTTRVSSLRRKILEMMTALKLERTYSKKEIIEIYLNTVFYGHNAYGIESASKRYFDKSVTELDTVEAATLVGVVKGPSIFNPISHPQRSKRRRNIVLMQMKKYGGISTLEFDSLKIKEIVVNRASTVKTARYFNDRIEKELNKLGRELGFNPKTDGLKVFTTLDTLFQTSMDSALINNDSLIQALSLVRPSSLKLKNRYRRDTTYVSTNEADSAFFANHVVQHGFIAIDHKTGEVLAHNGGKGGRYFFDHVFQGARQPGSTTKPFVYAAAIEQGLSPAHKLWDGPVVTYLSDNDSDIWVPKNWDSKYLNKDVPLRYGISRSLNTIAVRVQSEIGGPKVVKNMLKTMGINTSKIKAVPSLPLGSYDISPFEMVSAYTGFANGGVKIESHTIREIRDKHGNIIYEANFPAKELLNKNTAFIVTSMLRSSVDGTGRIEGGAAHTSGRIRHLSKVPWSIQVAAKTGTTNEFRDAWIIAYTPRFTAGLWMGIDLPEKDGLHKRFRHNIGLSSTYTVKTMGDFIKKVYDGHPEWLEDKFEVPDGVEKMSICKTNPGVKLGNVSCPKKVDEWFRSEFIPTEQCEIHTGTQIIPKNNRRRRSF